MANKLYKLALWYIEKYNSKWGKRSFKNELNSLDRLTYWNFGKYTLAYGVDDEWRVFSRYEVLDNAIQKLAEYENGIEEIRAKAITEFAEAVRNAYATMQSISEVERATANTIVMGIEAELKGE